jgi:triacylglycerol lipase
MFRESLEDILLCAHLCSLSYNTNIDNNLIKLCEDYKMDVNKIQFIDRDNAEGIIAYHEGRMFITWRGTNDFKDMLDNINIGIVPFVVENTFCGKVHKGFFSYYQDIKADIDEYINKYLEDKPIEIVFSGHSLGASICYAALEFSMKNPNVNCKCITFGSPKLGDLDFVQSFDKYVKKSYRFVIQSDIVPKLPCKNVYKHVGQVTKLSGNQVNKFTTWTKVVIGGLGFFCCRTDNILKEHMISSYIEKFKDQRTETF